MSPQKDIKLPPLTPSPQQRLTYDNKSVENDSIQKSEEEGASAVSVQPTATRKLFFAGSSYIYGGTGRKPQLLMHLESYVNKELHTISPQEPKYQELKLQVYRDIFGCLIKEFKTYQPVLSAIKKEYENTLAYQQDLIRELEPLRSHLRLAREECERKVQARWGEEQAEIGALKREKQQLQRDVEAMREKEKATQEVVERLQYELSNQYLQYREERDARNLLIGQLSYLTSASVKEHPADENTGEAKDSVELELALKVCRKDLTKAQEELNRMKAEYWDVVPQRNWDTLERTHKQTLLQLKMLQADFNQLKSEHDTLLELHEKSDMQAETLDSTTVQIDVSVSEGESHIQSSQCESGTLTVQESRTPLRTEFPLSDEEINELVTSAQSEPDGCDDIISSQTLNSLLEESHMAALPPALAQSEENAE
ncbi:translin-associated factor X-interacting protein 1 isoform X2 [Scophthalmus maximus]|uniref:translin-associated factor X-interacting protein 1 isoform X2 n=1 Tax=Scophthalmus maximus TaxID=52904 RepID=UPI001FA8EEF2|nr:translin-associated factor X-interacting protein 1 isoform X2 [Scophthalmus maximus]